MTQMANTTDDLFSDLNDDSTNLDPTKQYVEELVGEGKKFKTVEDLARGKLESDRFIEQLKSETEGLRNDLRTRMTLEELLTTMNSEKTTPPVGTEATPLLGDEGHGFKDTASLKSEDIEALINRRLQEVERTRIESTNLETVKKQLQVAFGSEYSLKLKQVADDMGLTPEYLTQMAKTTPAVLLKLVGVETSSTQKGTLPRTSLSTVSSSLNSGSLPRDLGSTRNKSYYDNIRKTDPHLYWTPKIQNEIHRLAAELGDNFR